MNNMVKKTTKKTVKKVAKKASAKASEKRPVVSCADKVCPVHGKQKLKMRGRTFEGTVISELTENKDFLIKGISSIENIALINLTGSGMIGVPGVSSRLFHALGENKISIIIITQASSEHSICFAIDPNQSALAKTVIEKEFSEKSQACHQD